MDKSKNRRYDLEERTTTFSEELIKLCKTTSRNVVIDPIVNQLIRSGTSIGANYSEANGASSRKDFLNKIFICKKEAKETMYWLKLLMKAVPELSNGCNKLWNESHELTLIFSKISLNSRIKSV